MHSLIYMSFRRMRAPLLVLISAYAISIGGLVLIPGVDSEGNAWQFNFFTAFYFVSFMGSTIGFGEIPFEFSNAQRLWVTVCIYLTVVAWLYAIGKILALAQDPAFKRAVTEARFTRSVKRLRVPFFLICGYGETGSLLVRSLCRRGIQSVVIDSDPERISSLDLEDLNFDVPRLCGNVRDALHMIEAGLEHPYCTGVVALTDDDDVNVKIAITSKLLSPHLKVIARAGTQEAIANMASFNTDHIINPFETFADHLAMSLRKPSVHLLYEWLVGLPNQPLPLPILPPRGKWVVCGFGRFGRAVHRFMNFEGVPMTVIEPNEDQAPEGAVIGRGTEAVPLREAGINEAVGIVAGTDVDANNLSIIVTARELNPNLYFVARQNRRRNTRIFDAAEVDLVMQASRIIVWRILPLLTDPVLCRFLSLARRRRERWADGLQQRIRGITAGVTPETWAVTMNEDDAPAIVSALSQGETVYLRHLLQEPHDRRVTLPCLPLLLVRGERETLLPYPDEETLRVGDQLLFCARPGARGRMAWVLYNPNALEYVETGIERPDGYIWRWWSRRRAAANASRAAEDGAVT
jgi:Trk K+ transport system NAD-binding subunit